jgi:sugar phosphate isomerase/epimerase
MNRIDSEFGATGLRLTSRRTFLLASGATLAWAKSGPIRVGCQANGFPLKQGDFPGLLKSLESMKSLGYVGFECNYRFVDSEFGRAAAAREQIEKSGLKFIGAHASMDQIRGAQGARILAGVASLGADCIVMSGSGLSPEGRFEKSALLAKAKELDRLGGLLKQNGLKLAYHNHNPEFANNNAEVTGLADNTDPALVNFLMDAGHGYLGGGNPAAFLSSHFKRIYGIHLKTFKGKETSGQVPLGQGDFDFEALAAAVKKTGWSGWIIDEAGGGPKGGNTAALGPDREHIRKLFGV